VPAYGVAAKKKAAPALPLFPAVVPVMELCGSRGAIQDEGRRQKKQGWQATPDFATCGPDTHGVRSGQGGYFLAMTVMLEATPSRESQLPPVSAPQQLERIVHSVSLSTVTVSNPASRIVLR